MADKEKTTEAQSFELPAGTRVSAEPELAQAMQSGGARATDSRLSTEVETVVDDLGVARTNDFERAQANTRGGRIKGSDPLRGDADQGDTEATDTTGTVGVRQTEEVVTTTRAAAPVADEPTGGKTRRQRS